MKHSIPVTMINKIAGQWFWLKASILSYTLRRFLNIEVADCQILWLLKSTENLPCYEIKLQEKADVAAKEADTAKAAWLCRVCLSNEVNLTIVPCGHVLCSRCSSAVAKCPFCRVHVTKTVKIYRPWQPLLLRMGVCCYIVFIFLDLRVRNWNLLTSFKSKGLHCTCSIFRESDWGKLISFGVRNKAWWEVLSLNLPILLVFVGVFCSIICSLSPLHIVA